MVKDLVEMDDADLFGPDEQIVSLEVFRQPSRPDVSVDELLEASIGRPPYADGLRKDYRPIMRVFVDAMLRLPGGSWQERWDASGAELITTDGRWDEVFPGLADTATELLTGPGVVVSILIRLDALRPGAEFLNRTGRIRLDKFSPWSMSGFDTDAPHEARRAILTIQAATGKHLEEITLEDLIAFSRVARKPLRRGAAQAWEIMKRIGLAPADAPPLWQLRRAVRPDAAGFVALYQVEPPAVAEMFVRYLRTREPILDYVTQRYLAHELLRNFWGSIRSRNPRQEDLRIAPELGHWWKTEGLAGRSNKFRALYQVRALYLDIAAWATHDAYWARWAAPSFIAQSDTAGAQRHKRRIIAENHQRIRRITPDIPRLMESVDRDWDRQRALLEAASVTRLGERFDYEGTSYTRAATTRAGIPLRDIPIRDEQTGHTVPQVKVEEKSFWAWAATHILHETGLRLEELVELTATALFTLDTPAGEKLLLLQIVPSKSDRERILLVSPELAHVLAVLRQRVRGDADQVPLTIRYDDLEREFSPPLPFLFQWVDGDTRRVFSHGAVRGFVSHAVRVSGVGDQHTRITPHDFRRVFATDALRTGLPVHILAKVMGHLNINTTQGYAAVFDEDVARHFREFVDRRRSLRPVEDYREPDPEELEEFQAHFSKRKVELGSCSRGYGTPCIHEHACIRCPMLRPDPVQRRRLEEIRANLVERQREATRMGWHGEMEGIQISIRAADEKLAQMSRIVRLTLERQRPQ